MLSDLQLVCMGPRNSTQLLKINTTKFQVERESLYIVTTSLKVSKYCDFLKNKHDIGSNFVERTREWFSAKHSIYEQNFAIRYITHLDEFFAA